MIQTVGIVGLGALGVLYGGQLLKTMAPDKLLIIADKGRIARYEKDGVYANGEECAFHYVSPGKATPVDLLIFTVKYPALAEAIEMAKDFCGDKTIILSFLNGVSSEQVIEEALPQGHLLYSCVQGMDATRMGTSVVYTQTGYIAAGEKNNKESEELREAADFFERTGLAYDIPKDIHHQIWNKWMLNVGVNQTCTVYDVDYEGVQKSGPLRDIMIAAMEEAKATANAEGILLTEEELLNWVKVIDGLSPTGKPSMRQDYLAGRKTEVDLFAKVVCDLGHKHGIAVPENEKFYKALTLKS